MFWPGNAGPSTLSNLNNLALVPASPSEIAAAYARGNRPGQAFEWLERSVEARDSFLWQLQRDLTFESLRGDDRFGELTRRLGLPD